MRSTSAASLGKARASLQVAGAPSGLTAAETEALLITSAELDQSFMQLENHEGSRRLVLKSAERALTTTIGENQMTRILYVGQKPETVDFSDPALPPGFDAAKINAGIAVAVAKIKERGWQGDTCMVMPDETAGPMIEKQLRSTDYDCVVIGGGLRLPPKSLALFESVINAVHKAAPGAAIAFNTRPEDTADAAARQLA
jgi:hypothetical protein